MTSNLQINETYSIDCTGDAVTGDEIRFSEGVFAGSWKKPKYIGDRTITAIILNDSYGNDKHQHTFKIEIVSCEGLEPLAPGTKTSRKGRNVYRNGTARKPWDNEDDRDIALGFKHDCGDIHRAERAIERGY